MPLPAIFLNCVKRYYIFSLTVLKTLSKPFNFIYNAETFWIFFLLFEKFSCMQLKKKKRLLRFTF